MSTAADVLEELAKIGFALARMRSELVDAIQAGDQPTLDRVSGQIRAVSDALKPPGGVDAVVL